jgi:hypothetical protein
MGDYTSPKCQLTISAQSQVGIEAKKILTAKALKQDDDVAGRVAKWFSTHYRQKLSLPVS